MVFEQKNKDPYLNERLSKYNQWLAQGKISFYSKVVPISRSLDSCQYILPTQQVSELLRKVKSIAITDCECRRHYQRCENPLDVCFLFNDFGDKIVKAGEARYVSFEEALEKLKIANENGLVHLSLYMPDHEIYALCNCCPCCCHDLQIMRLYNRKDLVVRSDYVAVTDFNSCSHCGICIARCNFEARYWENDKMRYDAELCYGCGLCVTTCSAEAILMKAKELFPTD